MAVLDDPAPIDPAAPAAALAAATGPKSTEFAAAPAPAPAALAVL